MFIKGALTPGCSCTLLIKFYSWLPFNLWIRHVVWLRAEWLRRTVRLLHVDLRIFLLAACANLPGCRACRCYQFWRDVQSVRLSLSTFFLPVIQNQLIHCSDSGSTRLPFSNVRRVKRLKELDESFVQCLHESDGNYKQCGDNIEDYMECLHHKKEV